MARKEYRSAYFTLTYTLEEKPPHPTIPYDYYNDTYTVMFVVRGTGRCTVEGNSYTLSDGDVILLSPEEIHSFQFENAGAHERFSIYFSDSLLLPFHEYELPLTKMFRKRPLGTDNKYRFEGETWEQIAPIVWEIRDNAKKECDPLTTARLHTLILYLLFRIYDLHTLAEGKKAPSVDTPADHYVLEICKYVKNHLDKELTYATIERALRISRYRLTVGFGRAMGMGLTEYIIRKRLSRATSLILSGEGIENAAYRAGFHTYSHFYKMFVKYYKASPRCFFENAKNK